MASSAVRDIAWVEGFRGIAAVFVVISHIVRAFHETLLDPAESDKALGSIFHLPFLRLLGTGAPWLSLFFLLSGYVTVYKPIKQIRNDDMATALAGLNSSFFRRPWRLILPATFATIMAWLMTQAGFFKLGRRIDTIWMQDTCPEPIGGFSEAVDSLLWSCLLTWQGEEDNVYDKNQWPMNLFLRSSVMLYVLLLGTLRCSAKARMLIYIVLYMFSFLCRDALVGMNIYSGVLLAELTQHGTLGNGNAGRNGRVTILCTLLATLFALFISGVSEHGWEMTWWSRILGNVGNRIFPQYTDQYRMWPSIGIQILTVCVLLNPPIQRALSHRWLLWLGSVSLPMYLIHGPLIRSVLVWTLFGLRQPLGLYHQDAEGEIKEIEKVKPAPDVWSYLFALPVFTLILGVSCHYWNLFVEPCCAYITAKAEAIMCPRDLSHIAGNIDQGKSESLPVTNESSISLA